MAQETTVSGATERRDSAGSRPILAAADMTDSPRDELASHLVDRLSLWSGAAGLIPVPLVDMAAVGGVQLHMLRRLSQIYGVPFSENRGKSILTSLVGADPGKHRHHYGQPHEGLARNRYGDRGADHAGSLRRSHLGDR